MDSGPERPEPTNEMRPEVERPEPGENELSGKSELVVEFERTEVELQVEIRESAEKWERIEAREISEHPGVAGETDAKPSRPGSEPH